MQTDPHFTDGYFGVPLPTSAAPILKRPFKDAIPADPYPRTLDRRFLVDPRAFSPRLGTRTGYTNLLTYSEDFTNAAWTKTNSTITAAQLANPWDGQSTFSKILEAATTTEHRIERAYTFTAVPYTFSALVAGGLSRGFVRLMSYDGTTFRSAFFDLTNGIVFGTPSGCTAAIRRYVTPAGAVSYKVSITFTPLAAVGGVYIGASTDGSTVSYAGDVTKGIYCGGAQLEISSAAGCYVVTTSAARTVSVPDCDGIYNASLVDSDDFSFLTGETDMDTDSTSPSPLTRTYASIPAPQSKPISKFIDRPNLHGLKVNIGGADRWCVSTDAGDTAHVFLTAARVACTAVPVTGGTYANIATVIHKVAHGLAVGDRYVVWSGDKAVGSGAVIFIFGADDFYISNDDITAGSGITFYAKQTDAVVRYVQGAIEADCQQVTTFYLLGFTLKADGTTISTSADIPLTAKQMAPAAWLAVLEANRASPSNTNTAVESAQGKDPYRGQILGYTYTKLQVADVYETQAV